VDVRAGRVDCAVVVNAPHDARDGGAGRNADRAESRVIPWYDEVGAVLRAAQEAFGRCRAARGEPEVCPRHGRRHRDRLHQNAGGSVLVEKYSRSVARQGGAAAVNAVDDDISGGERGTLNRRGEQAGRTEHGEKDAGESRGEAHAVVPSETRLQPARASGGDDQVDRSVESLTELRGIWVTEP